MKLTIDQIKTRLQTKEQKDIDETYKSMQKAKNDYEKFIRDSQLKMANLEEIRDNKLQNISKQLTKDDPTWQTTLMVHTAKQKDTTTSKM